MTRQGKWQAKRRAAGICTICGRNKLASTLRCGACLKRDLDKKKRQKINADLKAAGIDMEPYYARLREIIAKHKNNSLDR